jgi:hypothetical protein
MCGSNIYDFSTSLVFCLCLQVYSREVWRTAINKRSYDKQCDKLVWGSDSHLKKQEKNVSLYFGNLSPSPIVIRLGGKYYTIFSLILEYLGN